MSALHVIFKIADSEYAVPAGDVFQMESLTEITPVPGAPAYVAGLVQVRQQVVPVIDGRLRFGLGPAPVTTESRLVVLKMKRRLVGLLVDGAREVQNIEPEAFLAPSDLIGGKTGGFVKAVAQWRGRIIMLIDTLKVIGEETVNV